MAGNKPTFTAKSMQRIAAVVRKVEGEVPKIGVGGKTPRTSTVPQFVAKVTSQITARDGMTPGSGTITTYKVNTDGDLEVLAEDRPCVSLYTTAIPADSWIWAAPNHQGIMWVVAPVTTDDECSQSLASVVDYGQLEGYSGSVTQVLGHNASGCLEWISVEECP